MSASSWAKCPKCGNEESLREDYEMGITEWCNIPGIAFKVVYHAECQECGWEYSFDYKDEKLEVAKNGD